MLQFACPYCNGMFQVEPSMAGGEAMCPICHAVVVVPADIGGFAPPQEHPPAADPFDFMRAKRGGMFEGLDQGPPPEPVADLGPLPTMSAGVAPDMAALVAMGCPYCGSPFQVDAALAGQQAMCPACHGLVVLPDSLAPPEPYGPPPFGGFDGFSGQASLGQAAGGFPTPLAPAPVFPIPATPPAPVTPALTPPAPMPSLPPLAARSSDKVEVPLSARQTTAESSPTPAGAPRTKADVAALLPTESAPLRPVISPAKVDETAPGERTETPASKPKGSSKRSRAEKVAAMLPDVANPDEEVVAERPIAVEEPPDLELEALATAVGSASLDADAQGQSVPRRSAEERARLRRLRTLLLFGVGMLVLVLAAVLLPRMGFLIDIGKSPR